MIVGLIGTRWGKQLGEDIRRFYKGPLFVCGRDPERTRRVAQRLRADRWLLDWRSVIELREVTAVVLALPAHLHAEVGRRAVLAGKHMFVEKPLATTVQDCDRLIAAAEESKTVLMAGENVPFRADIREARRLLGKIGEPRLLIGSALHKASVQNDLQAGILLDFSVHHIRAVRELFGEPDRVFASCAQNTTGNGGGRDNVTLVLSSAAGWQAVDTLSWQAAAGGGRGV